MTTPILFNPLPAADSVVESLLSPAVRAKLLGTGVVTEAMLDSAAQAKLNSGGGGGSGGAAQVADYIVRVTGSPNSATYTATSKTGTVTTATDSSTVSGLRTVLNTIFADGIHIHFASGRFHFIDALLGTEAWANITGANITTKTVRITGEGINQTILSCRSNTITASPDLGILLFTNCAEVDLSDVGIEFCGAYMSTMEAVNCNQGNRYRVERVKFNRSKSTAITMDGGDVGKSARYDQIKDCLFQGRPAHPQVDLLTTGGTLTTATTYQYAVAWRDLDLAYFTGATASATGGVATVVLGGSDTHDMVATEVVTLQGSSDAAYNGRFTLTAVTSNSFSFAIAGSPGAATGITVVGPGTTKPSDVSTAVTTANGTSSIKVYLPIGPYSTKSRLIYRYDGTAWRLVQTIADNTTTFWTDTGATGTTTFAFGLRSTIPHSGVQLLATRGVLVNGNIVDGCGDTQIAGAAAQGIRVAQKQNVSCDRNVITQNIVRHSGSHGIYLIGAADNIVAHNQVSNPGTVATKAQAIRLSTSGTVNALRNLITANRCFDDQTAASPSGGVSTSPSITISTSCDNNVIVNNYLSDSAVTASVSDSGANNVVEGNAGFNAPRVAVNTGAPPAATANLKGTWYLRTDLNGGTLYYYNTASTVIQAAAGVTAAGGSIVVQDEGSSLTARATLNFIGAGVTVTDDSANTRTNITIPGSTLTVADEGTGLTQRATLDFQGTGVTVTDDSANSKTIVTIPGASGSGHTIQEEGSALTARTGLNFIGAQVTAADDAANNRTNVTVAPTPLATPIQIPMVAGAATASWTVPSAETEYSGLRSRVAADLTNATEMRLSARILTTAGAAGTTAKLQYSTSGANVTTGYSDICTVLIDSLGTIRGSWTAIPVGAKGDVYLRLAGVGGDGTTAVSIGLITAQVR